MVSRQNERQSFMAPQTNAVVYSAAGRGVEGTQIDWGTMSNALAYQPRPEPQRPQDFVSQMIPRMMNPQVPAYYNGAMPTILDNSPRQRSAAITLAGFHGDLTKPNARAMLISPRYTEPQGKAPVVKMPQPREPRAPKSAYLCFEQEKRRELVCLAGARTLDREPEGPQGLREAEEINKVHVKRATCHRRS